MHIVMLLSNAFRPDPRVFKEAQSLQEAGFNVTIICWDRLSELKPEETLASGVKIIRVQSVRSAYGIGARQILALPRFWRSVQLILNSLQPDFIHCHDFDTLPAGLFWGKSHHKPVIYDVHEYYADLVRPRLTGLIGKALYLMIKAAEKSCARWANAIVTVDEILAELYSQLNQQVLILGHYPQAQLADTRNPVFTRPEIRLLYAGRISNDRGALSYLDLLRQLRELDIPARLLVAGTFTPASEETCFWQHAQGVESLVEFRGWVPYQQMPEVYRSADIGLAILQPEPRYVAALPVKLFEYMAAGLPVIVSNFPAISSIITQTHCGVTVDPLSPAQEIAQIIVTWRKDPSIPQSLGENGRQAILSNYNWENQIGKLIELYNQRRD